MQLSNIVILRGHLGENPNIQNSEKGKEMCYFSLATKYRKKDAGGNTETLSEWHKIVCFGGSAKLASQYLKKGSHILLNGSLRTRTYENTAGETRYTTEVICDSIEFLDTKNKAENEQ